MIDFWQWIIEKVGAGEKIALLWVAQSRGSSPGRAGFAMAVGASGQLKGTIGGGIMEHKLVELAKNALQKNDFAPMLIPQFHDKNQEKNQSGMICSGAQTIILMPLSGENLPILADILAAWMGENRQLDLIISPLGLALAAGSSGNLHFEDGKNWNYRGQLVQRERVHIFGAGHSGLALSELMLFLGFEVRIYDDRAELNTLKANHFARQTVIDYAQIEATVELNPSDFVVIMTVGYRSDKIVLKQLIHKPLRYLGMLGSSAKIETLRQELLSEGISQSDWARVFTPIGLSIHSKTVQEIAVSIAAEIIRHKNADAPSGRAQ
jgi:xanthine dehydrogenase accessory factor